MSWWIAWFLFQQIPVLDIPSKNPHTTPGDIQQGKRLYAARCAGCHGPSGDGGKGANLAVPVLPRATDDASLYRVIRFGLPDTEMPNSMLTPHEIWQVAAFVKTLGELQKEAVTGDRARGEQLLRGKGACLQCHIIGLEGGRMGPPLTGAGMRHSPGHLREKILNPSAGVPETFRMVDLKTRDGKSVSGVRLNEDTWSIQVRDFSGSMHSFLKSEITGLKVERRTSMPPYRDKLSSAEIDDVVAYLAGLKGE